MKLKKTFYPVLAYTFIFSLLVCEINAVPNSHFPASGAVSHTSALKSNTSQRADTPRRRARTYDVEHYTIRTSFDVPDKTVFGEVDITLKPLANEFSTFDLDATNLVIERVSLPTGKILRSSRFPATLRISLDRAYKSSDSITVTIKYHAHPSRGLYFISPIGRDGLQRPAHIWTQGEPEDNHYWFPCYDFPDDKATSEQYITTSGKEVAIANGTLVETITNPNGTRTYHWQMDQPHSSYLISLIVGDFARLTDSYRNVPLEYYTYHGTEEQAHRAFDRTPSIMSWYEHVLNFDFPYDKYAQTVVGEFIFGGMENITATTFADTEILIDKDVPDSQLVTLVSHELAHSWFGDLVTCKDWANLWLNEGFATYMEASYLESVGGRDAYLAELKEDARLYFSEDPSNQHHPLMNPNYPLSMALFDETTYKKGALVIHMLRETVGDEIFWKAVNTYLNEYKYRTVDSSDLQNVFEKVSGQSLDWFFDQWVYKAGYPKLIVRSSYSPARHRLTLNVAQTQKVDDITPTAFRLPIEVEIVTANSARTEHIEIDRRTQVFTFQVDSRPSSVTFDKRASVLKKLTIIPGRGLAYFPVRDGADSRQVIANAEVDREAGRSNKDSIGQSKLTILPNLYLHMPVTSALFMTNVNYNAPSSL